MQIDTQSTDYRIMVEAAFRLGLKIEGKSSQTFDKWVGVKKPSWEWSVPVLYRIAPGQLMIDDDESAAVSLVKQALDEVAELEDGESKSLAVARLVEAELWAKRAAFRNGFDFGG